MTRRQPYDAATPYYGEPQLYEKEIAALKARAERAEEAAGDFQELERINAGLIRERDAAIARAEAAEAKVAKLREVLKPFAEAASMTADGFPDHDIMPMRLGQCRDARTALQETEQ